MARDYKNAGTKRRGKGGDRGFSGWVGLGLGLTLGFAMAGAVHFYHTGNPMRDQPVEPVAEAGGEQGTEAPRRRPQFSFYQMLPNYEVVIPEQDIAVGGTTDNGVMEEGTYILQVGSFRNGDDADSLRARLALLGIESRIQTVTIDETDTWHRVRVGPYSDLEVLNEIRSRLADDQLDALVIRVGD